MEGGVTPFSSSMAPSGSYILIVVSQPLTEEHKQIILQRLNKGLLSWDVNSTGCDLSGLEYALSTNIKDSVTESDVLIQHSTESLGVEVLLSPTVRTLKQCVKNLLSTATSHKQLVHAGYTFAGSGSWILDNGTFSFQEFLDIFKQADVQSQKRCTINVHCAEEGEWSKTNFDKDIFTKAADITLNPSEKVNHVPGSEHLIKCLESALVTQSLDEMMKPSPLVGNIRFNRPTIYMFPAGQGDCALFGINGFNMLIDGGFHRKPCSWDFIRHLDRLDAVLVTRIAESNVNGMSTLMKRNAINNANPQIGYVFCNIAENKPNPLKNGTTDGKDDLIVSVVGEGHNFVQTLNDLKLKPHQCWRDSSVDPFVLYHKVGQGTLEMHVLSPPRDSKEMKLFLSEWNAYKETFSGVKSELKKADNTIPLSHATSICAILVWRPEDPKDTITRILFPGSAPQGKILEGLEKLKVLNILNQPVVTKASLNIPSSKVISNKIEKSVSRTSIPNRNNTASPALSVSSHASRNGDIGGLKKEVKKVTKEIKKENKEVKKDVKKEIKKDAVKEVKKENKNDIIPKKDLAAKKESIKDVKKETKDVKKVVKKEIKSVAEKKDIKATAEKKDIKSTPKKESSPIVKATSEVKKSTTAAKKSTTTVKKDVGKPPIAPKSIDTKKTVPKPPESKTTKDVNNKKSIESKAVTKTKPKTATASPKTPSTPKTKPVSVAKPGTKMTKAVAASSIVASAVAVTVAAFEINEKKEVLEDTEPEVSEKEAEVSEKEAEVSEKEAEVVIESKEAVLNEKIADDVVSPLPPEALSPTPSESVSLTPSDTLSSAPLETVSPTPPLPNEPMSTEEKDVNEIKDLEQDMPYEQGKPPAEEVEVQHEENDDLKSENDVNDIEVELAKYQASSDLMSTSFVAEKLEDEIVEEKIEKTQLKEDESAPPKGVSDYDDSSEKDDTSGEKDTAEESGILEKKHEFAIEEEKEVAEERETFVDEKDIADEKEIGEEKDTLDEKYTYEEKANIEEEETAEKPYSFEDEYNVQEKETEEETSSVGEKDIVDEKDVVEEKYYVEEKATIEEKQAAEENEQEDYDEDIVEEKDDVKEKYAVEENELEDEDVDVVEEKDDVKEKDIVESSIGLENNAVDAKDSINVIEESEYKKSSEADEKDIDEQLARLSMEGSFCAEMMPTSDTDIVSETEAGYMQMKESNETSYAQNLSYGENVVEEHYEKKVVSETESFLKCEVSESELLKNQAHEQDEIRSEMSHSYETHFSEQHDTYPNTEQESTKQDEKTENFEITEKLLGSENSHPFVGTQSRPDSEELSQQIIESKETHFDHFSQMHSMEASFHQDAYDNYEPTNIDDLEMQETSVDEPEEIVRKESAVSITLNDDNLEEHYSDNWRRKSGTESEDDVDIGKYMCKEQTVEEEKLNVHRGSDSDDEDVVKSPTPHAVVDYEGQVEEITSNNQNVEADHKEEINTREEVYINEKEDFDEKDRDSAEEQDTDDGEMIRHPTPPEMKYSEEEMRDPIGQHFITNPCLKPQSTDITEQPLYEEAEDSESERSASPIIEQPVFGSVVQADFPELVTVSGGTTPSEPQSPKATLDTKKFPTEASVMEALSEHDVSESSTHSPSCQDGSTAFDLQGSERSVIEVQSLQDDDVLSTTKETKFDSPMHSSVSAVPDSVPETDKSSHIETTVYDDKEENKEEKQETPSDEEESSSEDENSESHSKDKSDAMGDRSDFERDDRSDIHNDDKSDHHHDGKSDVVNDDDDKSDIQEDEHLYRQQNIFVEQEIEDGFHMNSNTGLSHESKLHYEHEDQYEKQYGYENRYESSQTYEQHSEFGLDAELKSNVALTEPYDIDNSQREISSEENSDINVDKTNESMLNPISDESSVNNPAYDSYAVHTDADYRDISDYKSSYASEEIQYASSEAAISKESVTSEYQVTDVGNLESDKPEKDSKIEDSEDINNTFQAYETDFEHSKSNNFIYGLDTSDHQNEIETMPVDAKSDVLNTNFPNYSEKVASGFENTSNFENYESEILKDPVDLSHQHEDNFIVESTVSSELTKTHQYENVPHCVESEQITTDSETSIVKNVCSDNSSQECYAAIEETTVSEMSFGLDVNSQMKSFSSNSAYEYSSEISSDKLNDIAGYQQNISYHTTDIVNEPFEKSSNFEYCSETPNESFSATDSYRQVTETYSHHDQYSHEDYHTEKEIAAESTTEYLRETAEMVANSGYTSEITDINFNGKDPEIVGSSEFTIINGKDHTSFSLPPSDFHCDDLQSKETLATTTQQLEHESTYLVNNRFHSDSPEDNTMRSDSSPDVPYPVDITDMKNSMPTEISSETYMHNTEDYKNNINFSGTDGIPHSPNSHSLIANQNKTTTESDDEGNTHVRGNISPYAYTNKAYTREEEDIDGNHIYKEETEVLKQVEIDGNMQPLTTNQVSSVTNYTQEYQDVQYSTGANYDFHLEEWGKPMGLPTPPDSTQKTVKKSDKVTVKSKNAVDADGKVHSPSVSSKLSSPLKKPKPKAKESSSSPIYVDLAYVPQHADPHYCDVEFFKKIRARYYVISSVNPSKEVLNALLEAKKTWNEDLSVTIIPTYETDTLGYWMAQNQNDLAEYSIDVSPSASRCTVNLQDHQTSCSAYRLEF